MAIDEAKRFLEEFKANNELAQAVKAAPREEGEPAMTFYARVAAGHGFDFEPAELEAAYADLQGNARESLEAAEVGDSELDQVSVSGGWCWTDYQCSMLITDVKENWTCEHTYKEDENCIFGDRCNLANNRYYCTSGSTKEIHN